MQHLLKFTKLGFCLTALAFLTSCDKNDDTVSGTAKVSVTHASPDAPAVDVFIDNVKVTPAKLEFTGTTGILTDPYLTVNAGTRNVKVSPDGTNNVIQGSIPFSPNKIYSIFAFDTLSATSTLKGLVLDDNLAIPAAGKAHVRFLHLSPDAGNVDVSLAKTNDTTKISNKPYIGNITPDASLSVFAPVNAGSYNIIVKAAGTTPELVNFPFNLVEGKIYTVYAKGLKANTPGTPGALGVSILIHN